MKQKQEKKNRWQRLCHHLLACPIVCNGFIPNYVCCQFCLTHILKGKYEWMINVAPKACHKGIWVNYLVYCIMESSKL
jgi:hypothetical protein